MIIHIADKHVSKGRVTDVTIPKRPRFGPDSRKDRTIVTVELEGKVDVADDDTVLFLEERPNPNPGVLNGENVCKKIVRKLTEKLSGKGEGMDTDLPLTMSVTPTELREMFFALERMPDYVYTSQDLLASGEPLAAGASSVWPIDADREYAENPVEAFDHRRILAKYICSRLLRPFSSNADGSSVSDETNRILTSIEHAAVTAAVNAGRGSPADNMYHGMTTGEATIAGMLFVLIGALELQVPADCIRPDGEDGN